MSTSSPSHVTGGGRQTPGRLLRRTLASSLTVALGGASLLVGAPGATAAAERPATQAYATPVDTDLLQAYTRVKLTDPRLEVDTNFGSAVAVDGDTAVIGAKYASPKKSESGIAYVLVRTATGEWAEQARLTQSDPERGDYFGGSVAIDGGTIIVGAGDANFGGRAYVFVRSGSTWTQQAKLEATLPPGGRPSKFGTAVAIDGDVAVVGDPEEYLPEVGAWTGAAHVFARSAGVWTDEARLIDPTGWDGGDGGANMGEAVAVEDGTVVVGEPYATDDRFASGRAFVYTKTASGWKQDAILKTPDEGGLLYFGSGLDLEGGTLAIGQVGGDPPTTQGGSVFVYEREGAGWAMQATLRARDSGDGDAFGDSVSVYGDMIAVGAPGDGNGTVNKGAAYVFLRAGDDWTQRVKMAPKPLDSDAFLGEAVAIGADHLLFSAPSQSTGKGANSGIVWAYSGLAG